MINGVIIEIENQNNKDVTVEIFKPNIPDGVSIKSINSNYEYASLTLMALNEGFKGSGILTDNEDIERVTIYSNDIPTIHSFRKILENQEIIIDGIANYISIVIPATSKTILQLKPELF